MDEEHVPGVGRMGRIAVLPPYQGVARFVGRAPGIP